MNATLCISRPRCKRRSLAILSLFFLLSVSLSFAAENDASIALHEVHWTIEGRSRPAALARAADIQGDESWPDEAALEAWIAERRQRLLNQRVLDTVEISYRIHEAGEPVRIDLEIHIKDSFNIIAMPKPEYSSADGLDISIRARDYNFLGLLSPLKVNVGYALDDENLQAFRFAEGTWYADLETTLPLRLAGFDWELSLINSFAWTEDKVFQFSNRNAMGLTLPLGPGNLLASLSQGFSLNERNGAYYVDSYGTYLDGWYLNTLSKIGYSLDLLKWGPHQTPVVARSVFSVDYSYLPGPGEIGDERRGPTLALENSLSSERINWLVNLRQGYHTELSLALPYNMYELLFKPVVAATFIYHKPLTSFLGISTRVHAFHRLMDINADAGDFLRGLIQLWSSTLVGTNMDLVFKVLPFMPHKWFDKEWMRFLAFELHSSLFLDIAWAHSRDDPQYNSIEPWYLCTGIEAIIYPEAFRSLFLRVSVGFDTARFPQAREVYIGLGHHY